MTWCTTALLLKYQFCPVLIILRLTWWVLSSERVVDIAMRCRGGSRIFLRGARNNDDEPKASGGSDDVSGRGTFESASPHSHCSCYLKGKMTLMAKRSGGYELICSLCVDVTVRTKLAAYFWMDKSETENKNGFCGKSWLKMLKNKCAWGHCLFFFLSFPPFPSLFFHPAGLNPPSP